MAKVVVEQSIAGEQKKVYQAVQNYLAGRDTLNKLGLEIEWQDKVCRGVVGGGSFSGELSVTPKGKDSLVKIEIELPFLMSAFKGKVKEELEKHLSRIKA